MISKLNAVPHTLRVHLFFLLNSYYQKTETASHNSPAFFRSFASCQRYIPLLIPPPPQSTVHPCVPPPMSAFFLLSPHPFARSLPRRCSRLGHCFAISRVPWLRETKGQQWAPDEISNRIFLSLPLLSLFLSLSFSFPCTASLSLSLCLLAHPPSRGLLIPSARRAGETGRCEGIYFGGWNGRCTLEEERVIASSFVSCVYVI